MKILWDRHVRIELNTRKGILQVNLPTFGLFRQLYREVRAGRSIKSLFLMRNEQGFGSGATQYQVDNR